MTELVTRDARTDRGAPDRLDAAGTAPQTAGADLMAEVRGSVLRLLADLPALPGRLRVEARDIAVELEWPISEQPATAGGYRVPALPAGAAVDAGPPPADERSALVHEVTADTVGTFYAGPEPGAPAFVQIGEVVQAGRQLAIVEAMKLMIPVKSDVSGRVVEVLKADGQPVEFGEPLLLIERD